MIVITVSLVLAVVVSLALLLAEALQRSTGLFARVLLDVVIIVGSILLELSSIVFFNVGTVDLREGACDI